MLRYVIDAALFGHGSQCWYSDHQNHRNRVEEI